MERHPAIKIAKRHWREMYRRSVVPGVSKDQAVAGARWIAPSARLVGEAVTIQVSRRAWFPFSRETFEYYMESDREAEMENMNLGVDLSSLFTWRRETRS